MGDTLTEQLVAVQRLRRRTQSPASCWDRPHGRNEPLINLTMWKHLAVQATYQLAILFLILYAGPARLAAYSLPSPCVTYSNVDADVRYPCRLTAVPRARTWVVAGPWGNLVVDGILPERPYLPCPQSMASAQAGQLVALARLGPQVTAEPQLGVRNQQARSDRAPAGHRCEPVECCWRRAAVQPSSTRTQCGLQQQASAVLAGALPGSLLQHQQLHGEVHRQPGLGGWPLQSRSAPVLRSESSPTCGTVVA